MCEAAATRCRRAAVARAGWAGWALGRVVSRSRPALRQPPCRPGLVVLRAQLAECNGWAWSTQGGAVVTRRARRPQSTSRPRALVRVPALLLLSSVCVVCADHVQIACNLLPPPPPSPPSPPPPAPSRPLPSALPPLPSPTPPAAISSLPPATSSSALCTTTLTAAVVCTPPDAASCCCHYCCHAAVGPTTLNTAPSPPVPPQCQQLRQSFRLCGQRSECGKFVCAFCVTPLTQGASEYKLL